MRDKSKTMIVDKLLLGTRSPFTKLVENYRLPEKFKVPQILSYVEIGDPIEHLENFRAILDLHGTLDEVACRAFPLTLSGSARDWFRNLPSNPVDKFEDLGRVFLTRFLVSQTRKRSLGYLLTLQKCINETLKEFVSILCWLHSG